MRRDHRFDPVCRGSTRDREVARLARQDLAADLAGRSDQHEECEWIRRRIARILPRRDERTDEAAFAVAEQADARRIDARLALEPLDRHVGVACEIGGGRTREGTRRLRGAAVVVAEDGDSGACHRIGEQQERLVAHEGLIAVLRS
jgi:hypothetical protein